MNINIKNSEIKKFNMTFHKVLYKTSNSLKSNFSSTKSNFKEATMMTVDKIKSTYKFLKYSFLKLNKRY